MAASREHSLRAQIATEQSRAHPDPDRIAELRRALVVVRVEEFFRKVSATAPPLSRARRQHLAQVILGNDDEAA